MIVIEIDEWVRRRNMVVRLTVSYGVAGINERMNERKTSEVMQRDNANNVHVCSILRLVKCVLSYMISN